MDKTSGHLFRVLLVLSAAGWFPAESFLVDDGTIECGQPSVSHVSSRIVGGQLSPPGTLPWMAMLVWCGYFKCGGAILNSRFILTAAHCFDGSSVPCFQVNSAQAQSANIWTVYVGKQSVIHSNEGEQMLTAEEIFIHPLYDSQALVNDIALVKLTSNITYTSDIKPACLPSTSQWPAVGHPCIVAGYGETLQVRDYSLKQVTVPVVSDEQCSQPDWYGPDYYTPQEQFCAGLEEGGKDACDGDSGSPLSCQLDGKWYASGLVTKGQSCGAARRPGIYSNASYHSAWIQSIVALHGLVLP